MTTFKSTGDALLDAAIRTAYEAGVAEGKETGFKAGYKTGREAGFAEGYEAGKAYGLNHYRPSRFALEP